MPNYIWSKLLQANAKSRARGTERSVKGNKIERQTLSNNENCYKELYGINLDNCQSCKIQIFQSATFLGGGGVEENRK